MERILSRSRFNISSLLAVAGFSILCGFTTTASAETTGPDPINFSMVLAVLMTVVMLVFEVWLFWKAWKNRLPEEELNPTAAIQSPRPVIVRVPVQRKRTSRQRDKVLV